MRPASTAWFARHELRLAWRDWRDLVTAGGRRGPIRTTIVLLLIALVFHIPAWAILTGLQVADTEIGPRTLTVTTVMLILFMSLLLSQAMETVTRSLYTRSDHDLVTSSPASLKRLFTVRIAANTVPIAALGLMLASPFVNVLVLVGGPKWLAGYGVALALGMMAAALAVVVTLALFAVLGARRTRLVAQIVAAVIGASFAIGIQVIAILVYGTVAGSSLFLSETFLARLPDVASVVWVPSRAALGDWSALAGLIAAAGLVVAVVVAATAPHLTAMSVTAGALTEKAAGRTRPAGAPRVAGSPWRALRRKEWALLRRDPWLVSQTLTQLLYLVPPALLLTQSFRGAAGAYVVVIMVMVTVAGQLGGALAWLAVSGEDAPDLVATAPVPQAAVLGAKIEAVLASVGMLMAPLLLGLAMLASPFHAAIAALGIAIAAMSTIRIQIWFRAQARRSHFRRRHTSSRIATFAEALVSFSWAAAAGLAIAGTWLAAASAAIALVILLGARALSPRTAA